MTNILSTGKNKGYRKLGFLVKGIFVLIFFSLLSLIFTNKVLATPYCTGSMARDFDDITSGPGGANNFGVFGRRTSLQFEIIGLTSSDQVLERYIFDGQGTWGPPDSFVGAPRYIGGDYQQKVKIYANTGQVDLTVAGAWVYKDSSGLIKTITCSTCLRMFDTRETKNFGTTRIIYPQTATVTVTGSKPFIGLASFPNAPRGNNNGYYPYRTNEVWYDNEIYSWGLNARESIPSLGYRYSPYGWFRNDIWIDEGQLTPYSQIRYPNLIPSALNFDLKSAQFNPGEGIGSYADYNFDSGLIYSRSLQKNPDGTCGTMSSPPNKSCVGQYFGKPQCDARADKSKPGACQLNQAFGQVNFINENDPINYWKWSYCYGSVPSTIPAPTTLAPTSVPAPTVAVSTQTPTPVPTANTCLGQYFGKWQCDTRADKSKPGACQLNPAFGQINPSNENDPINYWKWSYCLK